MDRIEKIVANNSSVRAEVVEALESVLGSNTGEQYATLTDTVGQRFTFLLNFFLFPNVLKLV